VWTVLRVGKGRGPSRLPSFLRANRVNKPLPYSVEGEKQR